MYEKVSTNLNFAQRELEIMSFWKENGIFDKSIKNREGNEIFTFFDGPPTANGKPHIGHLITRSIKDIIPRYKTMKGYKVLRKAGWDTHGLPVELEVEKALGISGKPDIEKYGVEPFIKKCKESVWKYESEWRTLSDRVGFWADMESPYVTYHNSYIESVWWSIKKIWEQNLLYKGHRVVPYCPRCGTALSSHEVAQGYKDVKEKSVYAKFKLKDKTNEFFLAWTTTPWTLPSNLGLCVNPKEAYAKVKFGNEFYIMAEALLETVLTAEYEVVEKYVGKDLEYLEYEPLFDFCKNDFDETKEKAYFVVCDNYVTLTDGTGIVHIAPAFGEDDSRVGKTYGLPFVQLVNDQGKFTDKVTPWADIFVKDADPMIIKDLKESGKLFKAADYEHSYPFCWRCDTPLIYYSRDAWFIRMSEVRARLVKNNNTVNWYPDNMKVGRFGNWLENVIDWSLSRERYWGTPLPVWECSCGYFHTIGSVQEIIDMGGDWDFERELHKPYIDGVMLDCPKCSGKMKRVPEVIDCWYDSGSMPFAQWHYPFENKEIFEQNFPADFISEAMDQTRGWFYTLMAISTVVFDKAPYKNVVVLGLVQDENGQKMSKHKGNVVDPWTVLNKQGADATRWYFYYASAPWLPSRFSESAVDEGQRKFMGTLWNTYAFYVLYANIDGFNPAGYELEYNKLPPLDKWVLSKLNTLIKEVDNNLEGYKITESARALNDFVDELSNWYVRRSRERFWAAGMEQDKINAYMTLYTVLETLAGLSAPFIPFMAEGIYQNLVINSSKENSDILESVHLCDFPTYDESLIDKKLEENMELVLDIVVSGRAARNTANIKNRQPIGTMFIEAEKTLPTEYIAIVKEELNVKNVEFKSDVEELTTYKFKPQLRTLGKKYGKILPKISEKLQSCDGSMLMKELRNNAKVCFDIDGTDVELLEEDLLIDAAQKEGYTSESGKQCRIVLDLNLTDELIEEGFVREMISKIQTMRKESNFEVLDKITVFIDTTEKLTAIIKKNAEQIMSEVLALDIVYTKEQPTDFTKDWSINGESALIGVLR